MSARWKFVVMQARRLAGDESGATAIEYAMLMFIALAIALVLTQIGDGVVGLLQQAVAAFG
jgi:Flp pilus assembly pilin Flp